MADFFAETRLAWNGPRVKEEVRRAAGLGVQAAAIFLAGRLKEVLSKPAPRKRVKGKKGVAYYVATAPATPGAPPRKLSGHLRRGVTWEMVNKDVARVGTNVKYGRVHEKGKHPWLMRSVKALAGKLNQIIGQRARQSFRGV